MDPPRLPYETYPLPLYLFVCRLFSEGLSHITLIRDPENLISHREIQYIFIISGIYANRLRTKNCPNFIRYLRNYIPFLIWFLPKHLYRTL